MRTETDRLFRFKSYQAVCFSSCKTCELSTSYSPTRSLWVVLSPTGEKWETSEEEEGARRTREDGMRDAKVCAMRKFVANFMRLRSGAPKRDGIAPARFYGSFRFTFVIKIPRAAVPPQTIPLSAKRARGRKGLLDRRTRNVRGQQQRVCTCPIYTNLCITHRLYGSELMFSGLRWISF